MAVDFNLANQSGAQFRTELNAILGSIATNQGGATAPSPPFGSQWWADWGTNRLRRRRKDNTAWIDVSPIDGPPDFNSYRNLMGRNGGCEVWQRGAGGSAAIGVSPSTTAYTVDGWSLVAPAAETISVYQGAGLTNGSRYSAHVVRNSGSTGVANPYFEYPLDSDEIALARGQYVTLSMTMSAAPNWSPAGGTINIQLFVGSGTPAKRSSGSYTGETTPIASAVALTAVAQRFTFTSSAAIPANTTQASLFMQWTPVGTAGADDGFYIDDAMLEIGSVATPFERRPFEAELLACRRHFWKTFPYATAPVAAAGQPGMWLANQVVGAAGAMQFPSMYYPVPMRIAPIVTGFNPTAAGSQFRNYVTGTDCAGTSLVPYETSWTATTTTPAGSAAGQALGIHLTFDASI